MTNTEQVLLLKILKEAYSRFVCDSCEDFKVVYTQDNLELISALEAEEYQDEEDSSEIYEPYIDNGNIVTNLPMLTRRLRDKLAEELGISQAELKLL